MSVIELSRGLMSIGGQLNSGEKFTGQWDTINATWNSFSIVQTATETLKQ